MKKYILLVLLLLPAALLLAQQKSNTIPAKETAAVYNTLISKATLFLSRGDFEQARDYYKQALELKPGALYPIKMLKYAESSLHALPKIDSINEAIKNSAEIIRLMEIANDAILNRKYDSARILYVQVLGLKPVKSQEEYAQKKIATIDMALGASPKKSTEDKPVVYFFYYMQLTLHYSFNHLQIHLATSLFATVVTKYRKCDEWVHCYFSTLPLLLVVTNENDLLH